MVVKPDIEKPMIEALKKHENTLIVENPLTGEWDVKK